LLQPFVGLRWLCLMICGAVAVACEVGSNADGIHLRSSPNLLRDRSAIVASVTVRGEPKIFSFPTNGSVASSVTSGRDVSPRISPDETSIVFARVRDDQQELWIIDRSSLAERRLTNAQRHDDFPAYADSHTVVFLRAHTLRVTSTLGSGWTDWGLFKVDLRTGVESRISPQVMFRATPPTVAPGGGELLLAATGPELPEHPYTVDLSSGQFRPTGEVFDGSPAFGGSGQVAFVKPTGTDDKSGFFTYELFTASSTGESRRQVTNLKTYIERPVFTADSLGILFLVDRKRNGRMELWEVPAAGGEPFQRQLKIQ